MLFCHILSLRAHDSERGFVLEEQKILPLLLCIRAESFILPLSQCLSWASRVWNLSGDQLRRKRCLIRLV